MSRNFNPKVGDAVRFRSWEDMANEFGIDDGCISCRFTFTPDMRREFENVEFIITDISDGHIGGHNTGYSVSADMLEFADNEEYDTESIDSFLGTVKIKE